MSDPLEPVSYTFEAAVNGQYREVVRGLTARDMRSSVERIRREHGQSLEYAEQPQQSGTLVIATGYGRWEWRPEYSTDPSVVELQRWLREADKAADVDLGNTDGEIEALRNALSVALGRWPEIARKE